MLLNGKKVKALRKAAGYSAEELGAAVGVTGRHIRRYEAGTSQPIVGVAQEIAHRLGIPLAALLHDPKADTASTGCGTKNPHNSAHVDLAVTSAVAGASPKG